MPEPSPELPPEDARSVCNRWYDLNAVAHPFAGVHLTERGLDLLEAYVATVREMVGYEVPLAVDHLGHLAGNPLESGRVLIQQEDVADTISRDKSAWDAILLDVDNGPDGLTRKANDRLYGLSGLKNAFLALRAGGILSVWSSGTGKQFTSRLEQCHFQTEMVTVRARKPGKGARHTIWLATKPLTSLEVEREEQNA